MTGHPTVFLICHALSLKPSKLGPSCVASLPGDQRFLLWPLKSVSFQQDCFPDFVVPCTKQAARGKPDGLVIQSEDPVGISPGDHALQEEEFPTVLTQFSSVVADTQQYMIAGEAGTEQVRNAHERDRVFDLHVVAISMCNNADSKSPAYTAVARSQARLVLAPAEHERYFISRYFTIFRRRTRLSTSW